ncbi:hypothetical protein GCM10011579_060100 [Streptomyces albiflavescens]|uniref:RiboL-PSP-HEPN domain-containing protein n=2 Tax=Streptomyces albiflavescens TaxID=1623582 RepID=A0A917Y9G2_9ACTN|nr:hypothetical protein GCM10011579_060100 [Streptomyces albiflavescens]
MAARDLLETPERLTKSASDFYAQHFTNMMTFSLSEMAMRAHRRFLTSTAQVLGGDAKEPHEAFPDQFKQLDLYGEFLSETRPARREMTLSRSVDNFLSYISDILTQAIVTRPHLLKTREQVTLEEVLTHASLEDFVRWAAERRVNQLSFKGLKEIADYVESRLGLKLHTSDDDWTTLNKAVAVRNIVVHRRAIIDERSLWSVKEPGLELGQKYEVSQTDMAESMKCAMRMVRDFDTRISDKFDLALLNASDQSWFEERAHSAAAYEKEVVAQDDRSLAPQSDDQSSPS